MLAPARREKDVDFRVEPLGRVRLDRQLPGNNILYEAQDTSLDVRPVFGLLDVGFKADLEVLQGLGGIGQEEETALMVVSDDFIDIDAHQNADLWDVLQMWSKGEIARGPQVSRRKFDARRDARRHPHDMRRGLSIQTQGPSEV